MFIYIYLKKTAFVRNVCTTYILKKKEKNFGYLWRHEGKIHEVLYFNVQRKGPAGARVRARVRRPRAGWSVFMKGES